MNDKIKAEAMRLTINRLFNGQNHFSICDVDKLADSMGVNAGSSSHYKTLSLLHCVHYSEMSQELKAELPKMVMECVTSGFDTDGIDFLARATVSQCEDDHATIKNEKNIFRIGKKQ